MNGQEDDKVRQAHPLIRGSLDVVRGDMLHGWIYGSRPGLLPLVLVNGRRAALVDSAIARPDVCAAFNITGSEKPGFAFRLPAAPAGARLELYGVTANACDFVVSRVMQTQICEQNLLAQVRRAAEVARMPGSVGVVCWDGAHNPVGRAKELYEVAATRHPVVLVTYLHEEFGSSLWPPLLNWPGCIVAIPWKMRDLGHQLLRDFRIDFDTVWICKPRLPSFELAGLVSRKNARCILDLDDDETALVSLNDGLWAGYEFQGANLAAFLGELAQARTVSGPALQDRFGGDIVRHARSRLPQAEKQADGRYHIGFIGTVRPHKNVAALARAIRILAASLNLPLCLHVYGDIQPPEIADELLACGAELHAMISFAELGDVVARMDVLVCGFPSDLPGEATSRVNACQVPAKLSDALAAGRPVLVPDTPAVADLHGIPGIFPFTEANFAGQLLAALNCKERISLPEDFTPAGAYPAFARAMAQAMPNAPFAAFAESASINAEAPRPALLLIWKQKDAGIYGRRVDQIARSYKNEFPDHKIIILEIFEESPSEPPGGKLPWAEDFSAESPLLQIWLERKKAGVDRNGVRYKALAGAAPEELRKALATFLIREKLYPDNTLLLLFPIIEALEYIEDILAPYTKIVDVVDNELGWARDERRKQRLMGQYFGVMAKAAQVVFNCRSNLDFFGRRHFLREGRLIANWYVPPPGISLRSQPFQDGARHIVYSGNMNDRIDWGLLEAVATLPRTKLHLAGCAARQNDMLKHILKKGAIYHGVLQEEATLALLERMDAAIVPHLRDRLSMYMNPMKLEMYRMAGLRALRPDWLAGKDADDVYLDISDCIQKLAAWPKRETGAITMPRLKQDKDIYMAMLASCHPAL